jgi:hypothetical protein
MNDGHKLPPMPDDGLALWIEFYGGYHKVPPEAWAEWDRLHEAYRQMQRLARNASK